VERTTIDALALLPLPDLTNLSEPQERGKTCVWCGALVSNGTAVDLRPRRIPLADGFRAVFPRACRTCMAEHVTQAAETHASHCELCVDNIAACDTARAIRRLVLEHGR